MAGPYKMQYSERELPLEEALNILEAGEYCVVSTVDADGTPYGVPLSYVMMDGKMCFHTGLKGGHKIDDFLHDDRVSVAVTTEVEACFEDTFFTTRYASVIGQGHIKKVEDQIEIRKILVALCMKYMPEMKHEIGAAIEREIDVTGAWIVEFDEIRAKGARRKKK